MYVHTYVHTGCHKSWKDDASLPLLGSLTSTILSDIFNDIDVYTYRQAIFRVRGGGYTIEGMDDASVSMGRRPVTNPIFRNAFSPIACRRSFVLNNIERVD